MPNLIQRKYIQQLTHKSTMLSLGLANKENKSRQWLKNVYPTPVDKQSSQQTWLS